MLTVKLPSLPSHKTLRRRVTSVCCWNCHRRQLFIVHASQASVNVGKTRSGDVSIGFKLEDSTQTMWANCYGDKISRFLRLDVGRFNSMAHQGSLRTHIEQLFEDALLARIRVTKTDTGKDYTTIEEIYPAPAPVSTFQANDDTEPTFF